MLSISYPRSFDWDEGNNFKNFDKHGVTNQECEEVFMDENKVMHKDLAHSIKENRFLLIGKTQSERLLFLVFTLRKDQIRVISARDLNQKEYRLYEQRS